jgi:hypothetical protein
VKAGVTGVDAAVVVVDGAVVVVVVVVDVVFGDACPIVMVNWARGVIGITKLLGIRQKRYEVAAIVYAPCVWGLKAVEPATMVAGLAAICAGCGALGSFVRIARAFCGLLQSDAIV